MLKLQNVTHRYKNANNYAVCDINLEIESGTCFGLLGPNGAGKTTLISLMSGLLSLQSGQIYLNNQIFSQLSRQQLQRISLIPQEYAFYPQLTVFENLQFFASLYKIKNTNFLISLMKKVDILDYKNKLSANLSGGLKRRLNFAIGLINSPTLIFMDEITVGVDPASRQFILDSVKQLTKEGVTVIYTSHYLHEIESLCQKIAIMESGKILYCQSIDQILTQHAQQQCIITLAQSVPSHVLDQFNATLIRHTPMQTVVIDSSPEQITTILQEFQQYQIQNIQYGHGSLESFYLDFLNKSVLRHGGQSNASCNR